MVRDGWAFDWPRYSGGRYSIQQAKAEAEGLGLWAGFFAAPWEWRQGPAP
jgi:endonuclease YncB( thermonuclease family)